MNRVVLIVIALILIIAIGGGVFFLQQQGGLTPSPDTTEQPQQAEEEAEDDVDIDEIVSLTLTAGAPNRVEVVIATQDIPRGVQITPNVVSLISVPEDFVPFSAFNSIDEVVGQLARTDIARESFILSSEVVPDLADVPQLGSDAAVILPPNRVAVSVPVDRLTSIAGAVQPGDRVDIIVSFLFVDIDPEFQTILPNFTRFVTTQIANAEGSSSIGFGFSPPARGEFDTTQVQDATGSTTASVIFEPVEVQRPRLVTQTTVQDALVIWKGDFPADGRLFGEVSTPTPIASPTPSEEEAAQQQEEGAAEEAPQQTVNDLVTIAVSPQDAVVLTFIIEAGLPATFTLRSASSTSLQQTQAVTLDYILNRFNIAVPPKTGFSLEPAIRSIRSIDVGERIQLYDQTFGEPVFEGEGGNGEGGEGTGEGGGN